MPRSPTQQVKIYVLTNRINGKQYVGQTTQTTYHRIGQLVGMARICVKQGRVSTPIGSAILAFGLRNFSRQVLQVVNAEDADAAERRWINRLNTQEPNGYNCTAGGIRECRMSEFAKRRMITPILRLNRSRLTVGERNQKAKLTEAQVLEIRRRYAEGGIYQRELGEEYGITQESVSEILLRKHWRHI